MIWLPFISVVAIGQAEIIPPSFFTEKTYAQVAPSNLSTPVDVDDVEVLVRRGAALVAPEVELEGAEIDALGAWDVGEVLTRLRETLGISDQLLVIINGKRVPNPEVFSGFPPDALVRAELLPSEGGALYGGLPGQRVVNLVLQQHFSSYDGRTAGSRPTQGGTSSLSGDLRRSGISGEKTYLLGGQASRETALRADERRREILHDGLEAGAVTIRPSGDAWAGNAMLTRPFGAWSSVFSLNGQVRRSRSVVRFDSDIFETNRRTESLSGSAGLSRFVAGWSLLASLNGQVSRSLEDGAVDTRNENQSISLNASASRSLVDLGAGPVVANLSANLMESRSMVDRAQSRTVTGFQSQEGRASFTIPLARAVGTPVVGWIGDIHATLGGGLRDSSGGGGEELNGALAWAPRKWLRLNGAWSTNSDSISDLQRFEPLYQGAPRVFFDFRAGKAVEIAPILGGNPALKAPRSERFSLNAAIGPFTEWGMAGNFGYQASEAMDGIGVLPDLTADVEAAFPERFERDANGRLISVDLRPLNLSSSLTEGLTSGFNFSLPRPQGVAANEAIVARFSLNHSLQLRNLTTLLEGRPDLNRLKGDGGGVSRQSLRAMLDVKRGRWGLNASARWQDGYRTRRNGGRDDPSDLVLKPFTAVDLKLSFQMMSSSVRASTSSEEGGARRRSSGLQVNLEVENLFDARPEARLGDGSAAPGYGRDAQDPIGRMVRLSVQRRF